MIITCDAFETKNENLLKKYKTNILQMPVTKKLTTKTTETAPAPVVKKEKKTSSKKELAQSVEPVVETPEVAASVKTDSETDATPSRKCDEINESAVLALKAAMESLRGVVRLVRESNKAHHREMKEAGRRKIKAKSESKGERVLAGFTKPCPIKDALADFLKAAGHSDVERGCSLSRTDVTSRLNKYFVEKSLRDDKDKRRILFHKDKELSKIISFSKDKPLTYFNLQSAIKDQFVTTDA